jgi:hypothetical protein
MTLRQVFIHLSYSPFVRTEEGKGGEFNQREGRGATVHIRKAGLNVQYLQSINSDKHLPQSPFTGKFFR